LSVVVGGEDETVRIYYLGLDDLLRLAAKRVTRSLTDEECEEYLHMDQCPTEP
jgi:hypothetical protein